MVADTSALIAVLMREPDYLVFYDAIQRHRPVLVSTATAVEFLIVALSKGGYAYQRAVEMILSSDFTLVDMDEAQLWIAGDTYVRYGKGRHPAGLNFGDTFAYALAAVRNLPLLFKGNDFARTDVTPAV
jgi:ribonuclease VapC